MKFHQLSYLISNLKGSSYVFKTHVLVPKNKMNEKVLSCLYRAGYVVSFRIYSRKYFQVVTRASALIFLKQMNQVSKSSRPIYMSFSSLSRKYSVSDFFVISTPKGILYNEEVFFYRIGGLLLFDNGKYLSS